jgi:hypothetical protein
MSRKRVAAVAVLLVAGGACRATDTPRAQYQAPTRAEFERKIGVVPYEADSA